MQECGVVYFLVRELEVRAAPFDVELAPGKVEFLDPRLRQAGPLHAVGRAELVSPMLAEIRIKGHVKAQLDADCDRCLEPAGYALDEDFDLFYAPLSEASDAEHEIRQGEAEIGFYSGDGVELIEVLREYVHLTLPMQRLCQPDCKGICPVCGQNRNQVECGCETARVDPRWAALKSLQ